MRGDTPLWVFFLFSAPRVNSNKTVAKTVARLPLAAGIEYHQGMFFTFSKILWFIVNPGNVLLILLCLGLALLWTRWHRGGRRLVGFVAVVGLMLAVLPVGNWLYGVLEDRFPPIDEPPARIDGIIVAGGIVNPVVTHARKQVSVGGAVERLFAMAALAKKYPQKIQPKNAPKKYNQKIQPKNTPRKYD